jgi:deoxycytidylate deaminase
MNAISNCIEGALVTNKSTKKGVTVMTAIIALELFKRYIIKNCAQRAMGFKPCAKTAVYAILITADGTEYFGANWMTSTDVTVCPREAGELYEKCLIECMQPWHAECATLAELEGFEDDATDAFVFITGHTICCDNCQAEMTKAGVQFAMSLDSGKEYSF